MRSTLAALIENDTGALPTDVIIRARETGPPALHRYLDDPLPQWAAA